MEIFCERRKISDMKKPIKKRKNVISMAGMEEPFVMNLTNTVAAAKQNSASNKKKTPLCMINRQNTKEDNFQQNIISCSTIYFHTL